MRGGADGTVPSNREGEHASERWDTGYRGQDCTIAKKKKAIDEKAQDRASGGERKWPRMTAHDATRWGGEEGKRRARSREGEKVGKNTDRWRQKMHYTKSGPGVLARKQREGRSKKRTDCRGERAKTRALLRAPKEMSRRKWEN